MHGPQNIKDYNLNKRLIPQPLHSTAYHSMLKKQKVGENFDTYERSTIYSA